MLYLYALTDHPTILPRTAGLDGTRPAAERFDAIDAVVSSLEERVEPAEESILTHARVVEELADANAAVLPARFGRGYSDLDALGQAVSDHAPALREALERVRGCLELGLRVLAGGREERAPGGGGREYLQGRLEERQRAERIADELHAPLARLARADTRSVGSTPQLLLSASYLVPRDELDGFRSAVRDLGEAHPELTLACTGPWAAYSFATAEIEPK